MSALRFACPICHTPLIAVDASRQQCPQDRSVYERRDAIWRFMTPDRLTHYERFMREYQIVRQAERRGSPDAAYYRALPFQDLTGRFTGDWQIRAQSYRALERGVILPLEQDLQRALCVIDLGAGNGWLSYRLAQRGHDAAAVDLQTNPIDGLGAHIHYDTAFTPIQADFDHLPFIDAQADVVIFNAALHYSTSYETTLAEALRALRPAGQLIILDSPVYRSASSGAHMVCEREAVFTQKYGFPSNALPSENYLTYRRLEALARNLNLQWRFVRPFYGWRWALRPLKAGLLRRREPAQFVIVVGRRLPQPVGSGD